MSGGSLGASVTPGGVKADRQGTSGAAQACTCAAGHATLFVQRSGRKVREMAYRFESDAYTSRDLTLLSAHVAAPGLTQLAFAQEPDPILFCVRSDGVLVAMTYLPDQDVCAFSRILTDGAVEAACVVSNDAQGRDELWLVVRRSVPDPASPAGEPLVRRFILGLLCLGSIHYAAPWPGPQAALNRFLVLGLAPGFSSPLSLRP